MLQIKSQEGLSPVFVLLTVVIMFSLTGFTVKFVKDGQHDLDEELAYQEDLIAKNNVEIIKRNGIRERQNRETDGKCAPFFGNPTEQRKEIGLPVDCRIAIGSGFSDWRINIPAGQKSDQRFEFEVRDENGNFIQKIPVGDIDYSPATIITGTNSDDINFAYDINFDGYLDLRVLKFLAASNTIYDYWIFDPSEKKFEQDPVLTDVSNADFDSSKRTINAYSASGPDPANWTVYKYELIDGFFKQTVVK
jgi:hypothetical protein